MGLPLPGVEVKVINLDSEGIGELCFRGPMLMRGYYKNEEATKEAFDEEGFITNGMSHFIPFLKCHIFSL